MTTRAEHLAEDSAVNVHPVGFSTATHVLARIVEQLTGISTPLAAKSHAEIVVWS